MSYKVTAAVWKRYSRGGSEKLLALALAKYAQDDGTRIFPSVATLAAETVQSERTVQTQLKTMRDSGWLIVMARPTGGRQPTEYRIDPAWLRGAEAAPLGVQDSHPSDAPRGAEAGPQGCEMTSSGVQDSHPRGEVAAAPDKSLNQSEVVSEGVRPTSRKAASTKRKAKTSIPDDFAISERVKQWAYDKGHLMLDERLEDFRSKSLAKGYQYCDWDEAFMNSVRNNWANLIAPTPEQVFAHRREAERRQADFEEEERKRKVREYWTDQEQLEKKARELEITDPAAWSSNEALHKACEAKLKARRDEYRRTRDQSLRRASLQRAT